MTDNIQQLDSDDGLNVVQIDGTVIEPMVPAFNKINTNFETVLTDTTADATTKADAAEAAAKAYADGIVAAETTNRESADTTLQSNIDAVEGRTTDLETLVTQNQSKVGTGSFNTAAQNNIDAVNEVHGELDAAVTRIDGHDSTVADLQTQITSEVARATTQESTILSELAASSGVLDNQNSSGNPIKLWTGTQIQYSALTPDPDTLYFITG